jgi:hypothetical protein
MSNRTVQAALALDPLSTHWQVELTPEDAHLFVCAAEDYNNFTRADLATLIQRIDHAIPPIQFNPGNPNNGKPHHKYRIGNEGSRVIYLDIHKGYLKGRWAPADYDHLAQYLKALAVAAHADEYDIDQDIDFTPPDGLWTFRFWWD